MDVRMPDGTIISNVPDGITQEDLLARFGKYNDLKKPAEAPVTLREAAAGGAKRMLGSTETALSGIFGAEEAAKAGQARQESITERSGANLQKVKDVYHQKGLFAAGKEAISEIPTAVAEQFPNLAATVASARTGAMLGSLAGPEGTVIGGLAGAFVPSYFQQAGSNLERQAQEGTPISAKAAYGAAVPQAALDVFTDKVMFSRLLGMPVKHLGKEAAEAAAKQSLLTTLGKGTAKGIAAEVPPEVAQQMLERYQAGLSLTNDDARKEYADTAYQVALLGPLGAIGSVQERSEARDTVAQNQAIQQQQVQAAAQQAQNQATGVMEQQPLAMGEAPRAEGPIRPTQGPLAAVPEPTTTPPTFGFGAEGEFNNVPAPEVAPGQEDLFTGKGKPSPAALASVEAARIQGLPAQIAELAATPEGRAELSANRKMYFPDLTTKERNAKIVEIQRAGVAPVVEAPAVEGTLTPELLKSFGIKSGPNYNALVGGNLASPSTYNLLTTAASTNTNFGVNANRILEAFPQYKPESTTGVPNATQAQATEAPAPSQTDLFGVPEDDIQPPANEPPVEPSMAEPVQPDETPIESTPEPVGGGMGLPRQPVTGGAGQPTPSVPAQPSALAKQAAAALKKEPVATAWTNFTYPDGTPFPPYATLSKLAKNQIKDAHDDGYLSQAEATQIMRREKGNLRVEAVNKPEVPIEEEGTKTSATNQTSGTETDMVEAKHVEKNLTGKSQVEAARWIAENAPNKSYRIIAEKVADMLARLKTAGVNQRFTIVHIGDQAPISLGNFGTLGMSEYSWSAEDPYVHVYLKGSDFSDGNIGTTYETALHELIHAATQAAITQGSKVSSTGTEFGKDVDNLITLHNAVIKHFNARIKESEAGGAPLTSFEHSVYKGGANSLKNIKELVSWGLSNPEMQAYMESIPYKSGRSLWSEFVTTIRNLLGLPVSANTALSELLSVSESLLNTNVTSLKDFAESKGDALHQINPAAQAQAQQSINNMAGMFTNGTPTTTPTTTQIAANIGQQVMQNPVGALGMMERKVNAFRNKVVWRGATLADDIQRQNDNAFRDAYGNVRADLLLSQAENTQNITEAVYTYGGIEVTADGSVSAKVDAHSIDGVFRHAKQLAESIGPEMARDLITKSFYAWRAQALVNRPQDEWPINWQQDPRLVPTPQQIQAGLAAFAQFPELRAMRTEFIGSKNQAVKFLHQAGFLTTSKRDAFLADDSYAPWFRLKEYDVALPGLGNMGRMIDLQQMQALKGGSEQVNDMLENMAQVISWMVRSGVANHSANQALKAMTDMGTATQHQMVPAGTNPDNVVMTYIDGKRAFWSVSDPLQLQAFQSVKGMNSPAIKAMNKWLGRLRAGIVLFPAFPIRQVVMDTYRAYTESGVKHPAKMAGKVFMTFLSGEAYRAQHPDIVAMKMAGVIGAADFNLNDSTRGRAEAYGLTGPEKGITALWLRNPAYKALHHFAYSADLSVRLGIYRQTMEETGDKELAIARAREIINFQKSGTSELMITLKHMIPFLGAYLQGTDVNYRSMIGRGNSMQSRKAAAAAFWGNMATLAALSVAYTMCMSGDDDYEDQKGFITDRNFIIPGTKMMLPVPTDIGFIAKVIPERITDYIMQHGTDDPESLARLVDGIRSASAAAYMPPAAVYGVTPAIELMLNKSFFTDIPIVGQHLQQLEPFQQYSSHTSEFAKSVGAFANMSPMKIDYLMNAIGGTSAGAMLQMMDSIMTDNRIAPEKPQLLGTSVLNSFIAKEVGGRYSEEFYASRELANKTYQTVKAMSDAGETEKLDKYLERPEVKARMDAYPALEQMNAMMQDVRTTRAGIENDPDLSPTEKRAQVTELLASVEKAIKESQIRKLRTELE